MSIYISFLSELTIFSDLSPRKQSLWFFSNSSFLWEPACRLTLKPILLWLCMTQSMTPDLELTKLLSWGAVSGAERLLLVLGHFLFLLLKSSKINHFSVYTTMCYGGFLLISAPLRSCFSLFPQLHDSIVCTATCAFFLLVVFIDLSASRLC